MWILGLKGLRLRVSTWNFLGVYFLLFWWVLLEAQGFFWVWFLPPFDQPAHLKSWVPRTHSPLLPPWNCPQRSLKIWTDTPVAVLLDHSIEITKCEGAIFLRLNGMTGRQSERKWRMSGNILMVTGELYAMTNGTSTIFLFQMWYAKCPIIPHHSPPPLPRHTEFKKMLTCAPFLPNF